LGYELNGVYVVNTDTDARATWAFTDQYNPGGAIAFHPAASDLFAVSSWGPSSSQFRIADGTPVANAPGAAADLSFDFSAAMTKNGRTVVAGGDSTTRHYSLGIIGSATISANSLPPTAKITVNAYSSMRRVFDAFNSQPGNNGLTINKALWRFGDGTHAYGLQVSHTYALPGEYKARLTVTNSGGATNDAFVTVRAGDTTNTGSISGTVFGDLNSNGVRDSSKEKIVPNGYVWCDLNNDGKLNSGVEPYSLVQYDGRFALVNLAAGGPSKLRALFYPYVMTIAPKIKLAPGAEISGVNLAVEKAGVISSYVFNDINRNGRKDAFEDGAARRVWIDSDADGILGSDEQSTTSNADGLFSFIALTSATYHLRVELGKGDTQIVPSPGRGIDVVVKTWQKSRSDFAIRLPNNSTLTGTVYNDLNGNGVRESGELALIKQTVYLDYNRNGKFDVGEDAVRTNGIGKYTLPVYARPSGSVFGSTSSYYSVLAAMPAPWRHSSSQVFNVPPNTSVLADVAVTHTA
jgi:PKD repeat protein